MSLYIARFYTTLCDINEILTYSNNNKHTFEEMLKTLQTNTAVNGLYDTRLGRSITV